MMIENFPLFSSYSVPVDKINQKTPLTQTTTTTTSTSYGLKRIHNSDTISSSTESRKLHFNESDNISIWPLIGKKLNNNNKNNFSGINTSDWDWIIIGVYEYR